MGKCIKIVDYEDEPEDIVNERIHTLIGRNNINRVVTNTNTTKSNTNTNTNTNITKPKTKLNTNQRYIKRYNNNNNNHDNDNFDYDIVYKFNSLDTNDDCG